MRGAAGARPTLRTTLTLSLTLSLSLTLTLTLTRTLTLTLTLTRCPPDFACYDSMDSVLARSGAKDEL